MRALTSRVGQRATRIAFSRGGMLVVVFALIAAATALGNRTTAADAIGVGDALQHIPGIGAGFSVAGKLFGGVGGLAGAIGGKALKEALEWLFGGLEGTITLAAMRSVTTVVPLPPGRGGLILAIYVISLPIFAAGTMLSISQAMYGTVGGADPTGSYGRVAFRVLGVVVLAAAWYPLMKVAVTVANDISQYLLSNEVIGSTVRQSFAEANTETLAPILMLLVYLVLAVSWLLLVVTKGALALSFVMIALGGPVVLALSTLPGCNQFLGWLGKTVGTLIAIPALWAFVFGAWAFVGSALWEGAIPGAPSGLYRASLFIAAMIALYGVTKVALKAARIGLPAGVPGGQMAKVGMGVMTAMAAREGAQALMSAGTATRVEEHTLGDGVRVRQQEKLRGAAAKEHMQRGRETTRSNANAGTAGQGRENRYAPAGAPKRDRVNTADEMPVPTPTTSGSAGVGAATSAGTAAGTAQTRAGTGTAAAASAAARSGSALQYNRDHSVQGPSNAAAHRAKADWDKHIASVRGRAAAATSNGAGDASTASAAIAQDGTPAAAGLTGASGSAKDAPMRAVQEAGKAFSPADRASFHRLAMEALAGDRTPQQAQKNFSNAMSSALAGAAITTSSPLAEDAAMIATAPPVTVAEAFSPAGATDAPHTEAASATAAFDAAAPATTPAREDVAPSGARTPLTYEGAWRAQDSPRAAQPTPSVPEPTPAPEPAPPQPPAGTPTAAGPAPDHSPADATAANSERLRKAALELDTPLRPSDDRVDY